MAWDAVSLQLQFNLSLQFKLSSQSPRFVIFTVYDHNVIILDPRLRQRSRPRDGGTSSYLPLFRIRPHLATARGESTALKALIQSSAGKVQFIGMDNSKEISIKAAVAEVDRILEGQGLDVLVNNAGQPFTLNSTTTMYAPPFCKTIRNI